MKKIILASKSPDRKKILERAGIPFISISSTINEDKYKKEIENAEALVRSLATAKALNVKKRLRKKENYSFIIGADTIVEFKAEIIGKATNKENAFAILKRLSGSTHSLITGVAITPVKNKEIIVDTDTTQVEFLHLSNREIWSYIETQEWKGRAGAYSIKDQASIFIKLIHGSPSNVIGLPMQKVFQILKDLGLNLLKDITK